MRLSTLSFTSISLLMMSSSLAFAAGMFPDVTDSHPFKAEIESLSRAGIVKGNPDGKFYPDRNVNRAEFLKLLYLATNRVPKAVYGKCFKDIEAGSWYELYVCDAASKDNNFVGGYPDATFRPSNPVSRTEALKMLFTVLKIETTEITQTDKDIIKFVDLSTAAWYSKYVSTAYKMGILPISGFTGAKFYPEKALTRAEAAAYIFQGLHPKAPTSSVSSSTASSTTSQASSSSPRYFDRVKQVSLPWNDTDQFEEKKSVSYMFTLTAPRTIVSIDSGLTGKVDGDMTCRLYLLTDDGFADEYYLGVQDKNVCKLSVALRAGSYQLQVQPSVANSPFFVNAVLGSSDGNDGFMDAQSLKPNVQVSASLEGSDDLFDWYKMKVDSEGKSTVVIGSADRLACIIYTPSTVDQFGFTGPECGVEYFFKTGEYIIGVGRKAKSDTMKSLPYTVKWKW